MPNGSGIDLVSWMKEHSREIICVFLTCHSDFSYAKRAISLGVLDYLLKPVDYDELEEVIEKAIQKKKNEIPGFTGKLKRISSVFLLEKNIIGMYLTNTAAEMTAAKR